MSGFQVWKSDPKIVSSLNPNLLLMGLMKSKFITISAIMVAGLAVTDIIFASYVVNSQNHLKSMEFQLRI